MCPLLDLTKLWHDSYCGREFRDNKLKSPASVACRLLCGKNREKTSQLESTFQISPQILRVGKIGRQVIWAKE